MIGCQLPSFEYFENSLKNRKWAISFVGPATQQDVVSALKFTDSHFKLVKQSVPPKEVGDDLTRYTLYDPKGQSATGFFLNKRVTDKTARKFRQGKTEKEIAAIRANPNNIEKREYGTVIHNALQEIVDGLFVEYQGKGTLDTAALLKKYNTGPRKLTASQLKNLISGAKDVFQEIKTFQERVNPDGKFELLTENVIVDPVYDVAGTIDIVVIFSDGTGAVVDFKTFSSPSGVAYDPKTKKRTLVSDHIVTQTTKDSWRLQLSEYKRILLANYGVKDIMFTRVAPIWMDFEYDEKKITGLDKVEMGKTKNPILRSKSIGTEKIGVAYVDDFLKSRYKELENLRIKYKKTYDQGEKTLLIERMVAIEKGIEDFVQDLNLYRLVSDANRVAATADSITDIEELRRVRDYLESIVQLRNNWERDLNKLFELDTELDQINKALSIVAIKIEEIVLDGIESRHGKVVKKGGKFILSEDDTLSLLASSTTDLQNPFVLYAQDLFQQSYNNTRDRVRDFDKRLDNIEQSIKAWLKGRGETLADIHKYLLNPDTMRFYSMIDKAFYDLASTARENKDVKFFTTHYKIREKNRKGETYSEWLSRSRDVYEERLEEKHEGKANKKTLIEKDLEWWDSQYNLSMGKGKPKFPSAWLRKNNGWLEMKESSVNQYKSKEYKFIEANTPLKLYYDQIREFISEFREIAGDEVRSNLFFPLVRATIVEKAQNMNFAGMGEDLRQVLSIREDEQMFGQQDEVELDPRVPLYYTNPFRDANGNIVNSNEYTKDIGAAMRLFAKTVYNYQHMNEIEATVLAVKDILKTVEYEKAGWGKNVFDFMHNVALKNKEEGDNTTQMVFNTLVNYHLYGIKMQTAFNKKFTYATTKLASYFSLRTLGLGFIPAAASYAAAKLSARLEGTKGAIFTIQQWDKSTGLMINDYKKYHALAFFFGIHSEEMVRDIVAGRVGEKNSILADKLYASQLNQYLNDRLLMRPFSYGDERLDNHIAVAMAQNYGFDDNGNIRRLVNLPENSKSVYERIQYNEKEMFIEGLDGDNLSRAITQFQQAVRAGQRRIKGSMNSEEIAYYQTNLFGRLVMQFKTWMPGIIRERFGALKYNRYLDVAEQGRYQVLLDETQFTQSSNMVVNILGTTANLLKFLAINLVTYGTIARKLGLANYKSNEAKAREQYAAFIKKYENMPGMLERFPTFEQFVEMKHGQIKAALGELEFMLVLSAAIFAMASDWDDDDEPLYKEMWLAHKIYQVLNRTKTELTFTYDPLEYAKLIRNPFPISSLFIQIANLLTNTLDELGDTLLGEDTERFPVPFGKNKANDKTDKLHYTIGLIPAAYQVRKTLNLLDSDAASPR
jgi:hypothetical protein